MWYSLMPQSALRRRAMAALAFSSSGDLHASDSYSTRTVASTLWHEEMSSLDQNCILGIR